MKGAVVGVAEEVKAFIKSNKGGSVSVSLVKGNSDGATVDLDGYEGRVCRHGSGGVLFESQDEDAGFQSLAAHLASFCNARARSVAEVLSEAVRAFPKHVKVSKRRKKGCADGFSRKKKKGRR